MLAYFNLKSCSRQQANNHGMPKAAAVHYLNVYHSCKSSSRSAKKQRLRRFPVILWNMNVLGKVVGIGPILEPEKKECRSRRFDHFVKVKVTCAIYPLDHSELYVTVHDNVAVAVIVSNIWDFEDFRLNMCQCHESRLSHGHPKLFWCNDVKSMSSGVTVAATPHSTYQAVKIFHMKSRRADTVAAYPKWQPNAELREVPKINSDFAHLYLFIYLFIIKSYSRYSTQTHTIIKRNS